MQIQCGGDSETGVCLAIRRRASYLRAMASPNDIGWAPPPTSISRALATGGMGSPLQWRQLAVQAGESSIFEIRAEAPADKPFHAIAKLYNQKAAARATQDAELLRSLHALGRKVPAVLGVVLEQDGLILEWCGPTTLADLLKSGQSVAPSLWVEVVEEVAAVHLSLGQALRDKADVPVWSFTPEQRRAWAMDGLEAWLDWIPEGPARHALLAVRHSIDDLVSRLVDAPAADDLIWGDCNPKNILVHDGDIRLIDPQVKRGSPMLDLVLLFTFADSPETYLPRSQVEPLLTRYFECRGPIGRCMRLDEFLRWYDSELLWRILVYGGMLLRRRDARLPCWREVCQALALDLPQIA